MERIAEVAIDCPGRDSYSYRVPPGLEVACGSCVEVDFAHRRLRAFVIDVADREPPPGITLKPLLAVRPDVHLPPHLLALIRWGARYYRCSLGEFLAGAVPEAVRAGRQLEEVRLIQRAPAAPAGLTARQRQAWEGLGAEERVLSEAAKAIGVGVGVLERLAQAGGAAIRGRSAIQEVRLSAGAEAHALTEEQAAAVAAVATHLEAGTHAAFLLYGITGSGKTLVYLELALRVIAQGRQVLMLLPEIALTPQLAARVRSRVERVGVWHSGFTDSERAALWRAVAAGEVDLVLGTRSALFAPLPRPGLILVDEEHETSYKQESVPRYQARDLAVVYARALGVPIVLGSATPSLETIHNAHTGRYQVLPLRSRPLEGRLPRAVVVDMREEFQASHAQVALSRLLVEELRQCARRQEQAIILLNRRGWAPVVTCQACGTTLGCRRCDITLTFHRRAHELRCHYCDFRQEMPVVCPACGKPELSTSGIGTEQLAHAVAQAVPSLRVLRVDADTVAERQGHARLFQAFSEGAADCLVGTQMVAKGLDFPRVTLVGVVGADRALAVPDFRAGERTYQLLAQVSGRAGRGARPGLVVVQAFDTQAPAVRAAVEHRPRDFVDPELALREAYGYPPFAGLARILWTGERLPAVEELARAHGERMALVRQGEVILGPNPAGLALLKGQHRWHALVKGSSRGAIQAFLDRLAAAGGLPEARGVHVAIDVDPYHTA